VPPLPGHPGPPLPKAAQPPLPPPEDPAPTPPQPGPTSQSHLQHPSPAHHHHQQQQQQQQAFHYQQAYQQAPHTPQQQQQYHYHHHHQQQQQQPYQPPPPAPPAPHQQHGQHYHYQPPDAQPQLLPQPQPPGSMSADILGVHPPPQPPQPEQPSGPQAPAEPPPPAPVDARQLILPPGRSSRPARLAIVLRGAPGSGKSWAAKRLRDLEVQHGGAAPRIHSIDDYFMQEKESVLVEKGVRRKVMTEEYEYEAEMEEAYAADLLKVFRRTVAERKFALVIVDAPNLKAAALAGFWEAGQKAGYDIFVAQALESRAAKCHERNIHDRSLEDIDKALAGMEAAPDIYQKLDLEPLLCVQAGDGKAIKEVEMEMDGDAADDPAAPRKKQKTAAPSGRSAAESRWGRDDGDAEAPLGAPPSQQHRSILKAAGGAAKSKGRRVTWADAGSGAASGSGGGFRLGGAAAGSPLEQVYVLEGLGPGRDEGGAAPEGGAPMSSLRSVLLGGRQIRLMDGPLPARQGS